MRAVAQGHLRDGTWDPAWITAYAQPPPFENNIRDEIGNLEWTEDTAAPSRQASLDTPLTVVLDYTMRKSLQLGKTYWTPLVWLLSN